MQEWRLKMFLKKKYGCPESVTAYYWAKRAAVVPDWQKKYDQYGDLLLLVRLFNFGNASGQCRYE